MVTDDGYFDIRSKAIFLCAGVLVPLVLFSWAYQSGNRFLSQEIPLVDSIMQLRVDIIQTHGLIHEFAEGHQTIDEKEISRLVNKIRADAVAIDQGYVQMDGIISSESMNSHHHDESREMKQTVEQLTDHLLAYEHKLIQLVDDDVIHDDYFKAAEWAAYELDYEIHKQFSKSLDEQPTLFAALFIVWILMLLLMISFLKKSRIAHAEQFHRNMKLAQALEHSGSAIIITDTDAVIEYVNAAFCKLSGYESLEVIGKNTSILNSGNQPASFYQHLWQVIGSGKVWHRELLNRRKDGSTCPVVMSIAPIFNQQNRITHYIASQEDMSEFEALEEKLYKAKKLETAGILAGGIAHDFNNALTAIKANAMMLERKPDQQDVVVKRASAINQVCDVAAKHISQLLKFVRNEELEMREISLNVCMTTACEMAAMGCMEKNIISVALPDADLHVNWNDVQAQQIMINLINNSLHAVQAVETPFVQITVSRFATTSEFTASHAQMHDANYALISVKDNGYGIPEDQLENIFEVFFTTKVVGEGTGLGLSMAYGTIAKIGGVIEVESKQGQGTEFRIYIPLLSSEA